MYLKVYDGEAEVLHHIDDGGFLLDTWYDIRIEFRNYNLTVEMTQEVININNNI